MEQIACPDCQLPLDATLVFGHLVRQHQRLPRPDEDLTQGDQGDDDDCIVVGDTAMLDIVSEFISDIRVSVNRKREKEASENLLFRLNEARKRRWQSSSSAAVVIKSSKPGHRIATRAPLFPLPPPPSSNVIVAAAPQ